MKKYKHVQLVPVNKTVEGHSSFSETSMNFKILNSIVFGSTTVKSKLNKEQKELFLLFQQEQQRLNRIAEKQFLRKYLLEQRNIANELASYIRKRNAKELKTFGRIPIMISVVKDKKHYLGAPVSEFKITNDVKDLRSKINTLDRRIARLRSDINSYEMEDYQRWDEQNGGGWRERMKKRIHKSMKKVA